MSMTDNLTSPTDDRLRRLMNAASEAHPAEVAIMARELLSLRAQLARRDEQAEADAAFYKALWIARSLIYGPNDDQKFEPFLAWGSDITAQFNACREARRAAAAETQGQPDAAERLVSEWVNERIFRGGWAADVLLTDNLRVNLVQRIRALLAGKGGA